MLRGRQSSRRLNLKPLRGGQEIWKSCRQRHTTGGGRKYRNPGMVRLLASTLQVDCSPFTVALLLYKYKLSKNI